MRKLFVLFGLVLVAGSLLVAQEVPTAEVYLGYTFTRVNTATHVDAFTANGGLGAFQVNFNRHFGIVADFAGTHNGKIDIFGPTRPVDQTQFSYLFGPRLSINKAGHISPFFEYLVGGIHNSRSFAVPNVLLAPGFVVPRGVGVDVGATTTRFKTTQNAFAMAVGGGLDINLSKTIAVRPIQLDYLPSHFSPLNIPGVGTVNNTRWQQNLRYSAGITFRLGTDVGY